MKAHQAPRGKDLEEEGKNRVQEEEMGWIEERCRWLLQCGDGESRFRNKTAEKQTPHQSGQCGADTFYEARQMIRKEAPSVVGAKEEQGYGASGGGYVSPCVGEKMLASLSATLSFVEDQVLGQTST